MIFLERLLTGGILVFALAGLSVAVRAGAFEPAADAEDESEAPVEDVAEVPGTAARRLNIPVTQPYFGRNSQLALDTVYSGPWSKAILRIDPSVTVTKKQEVIGIVSDHDSVAEPFMGPQSLPDVRTDLELMLSQEDLQELQPPAEQSSLRKTVITPSTFSLEPATLEPGTTGNTVSGFDASAAPDQMDQVGGSSTGGIVFAILLVVVLAVGFMVRMMSGSSL